MEQQATVSFYSAQVFRESRHPHNMRRMDEPDTFGVVCGECGDSIEMYLRLDGESIREAAFVTDGQEAIIACGSQLTRMVEGLTLDAASGITAEELIAALGGLPGPKHHCARLTVNALQEALASWRMDGAR